MSAYDNLLDGLANIVARNESIWDHTSLLSGYSAAVLQMFMAGIITADEFTEIDQMVDEMRWGFEPASIESMEEAA